MIDVSEDEEIGVDENEFFVFGELPDSELAVIPFVVRVLFGERVADAVDETGFPTGGAEGADGTGGQEIVVEEEEDSGGVRAPEALGQGDRAADVGFGGVEDGDVSFFPGVTGSVDF